MISRRAVLSTAAALPFASGPPTAPSPAGVMRAQLRKVVAQHVPGALAHAAAGSAHWWASAGRIDLPEGRPPRPGDRYRIASITKTFVATVVLQLVAEGRLGLDDPVQRHLPGLLRHGALIRLRHLLQHTSGLPDYHRYEGLDSAAAYLARRYQDPDPRQSIDLVADRPLLFTPGTAWSYADTNYLVLDLVVRHVTAVSVAEHVNRRIITPLRLTGTSFPQHQAVIAGPHLRGWLPADAPGRPFEDAAHPVDYTDETIAQTGAAGAMISTGSDLLCFLRALLRGALLPPALLEEMTRTYPTGFAGAADGLTGYGLGIAEFTDPRGRSWWGNSGSMPGYTTALLADRSGTHALALAAALNPCPAATATAVITAAATIADTIARHDEPGPLG